ncbi:MAG: adenosine kinase [Lentisphaeria bacterium]|nr:adenosine kinase [Lentisphaeria bacterium]
MAAVLGVGSPLLDVLARVSDGFLEKHVSGAKGGMEMIGSKERLELTALLEDAELVPGGSAGNTVFALARMGIDVAMLGKIGHDRDGDFYKNKLVSLGGSENEFIRTEEVPTGVCLSLITPDAERTMRSDLGAAARLTPEDVANTRFSDYGIVLIEGYMLFSAAFDAVIEGARKAGCKIAFDLASFEVVNIFRDRINVLLDDVDILFANADEAAALVGNIPEDEQLEELAKHCPTAVLKLGKRGAMVKRNGEKVRVPAELVENPVDTTAAGDLWAAGFLYGTVKGHSLEACAKYGSILSGEVVQVIGSQLPDASWEKIEKALSIK